MKKSGSTAPPSNPWSLDATTSNVFRNENPKHCQHFSMGNLADQRSNAARTSSVKQRAPGGTKKAPVEVINLDDSDDETLTMVTTSTLQRTEKRPCLNKGKRKEQAAAGNGIKGDAKKQLEKRVTEQIRSLKKASVGNGVATCTLQQTEMNKGKSIITEVQDDGPKSFRPWKKGKAMQSGPLSPTGVSSFPHRYNSPDFRTLETSRYRYIGLPHGQGQAVMNHELNAGIARTANIRHRQHQERSNLPSSSTLDLSLSLCFPGTQGNQEVGNECVSFPSEGMRKRMVDALANDSVSAVKSRRLMEMGKFLEKPFSSWDTIHFESKSFIADGSTRPQGTATANRDTAPRKYANATGESSRLHEDKQEGTVKKSGTGANPQVCIINRNPADFSVPGPHNIYMIEGKDFKVGNRLRGYNWARNTFP